MSGRWDGQRWRVLKYPNPIYGQWWWAHAPTCTGWASGAVHCRPFDDRLVALDYAHARAAEDAVTMPAPTEVP